MICIKHQWSHRYPGKIWRRCRKGLSVLGMSGVIALVSATLNFGGCGRSSDRTSAAADTGVITSSAGNISQASFIAPAGARAVTREPAGVQYVSSAEAGEALVMGTSTVHNWTVKTSNIQGDAQVSGDSRAGSAQAITLDSIKISIPVTSLKSTEGSGMDKTMYDALNSKKFPNISYKLTKATLRSAPSGQSSAYHFDTTGLLSISGNEHPVALDLAVTPEEASKLTIAVEVKMKMSDWGVKPPTAMLGMIKSGDAITVKVAWQLVSQQPASRPGK